MPTHFFSPVLLVFVHGAAQIIHYRRTVQSTALERRTATGRTRFQSSPIHHEDASIII
jgi:hypothetical protein